jgi:hypothetical protein
MSAAPDFTKKINSVQERKLARRITECGDKLDACAAEIDRRYGKGFAKTNPCVLAAFFSVVMSTLND